MQEENTLIALEDVDISNGGQVILFGINITIKEGDFVYLIGKVGTGKTSIFRTLMAENPPAGGKAAVCGYDLAAIRKKDIPMLRRKMGIVFQDFQLLMDRSVHDNLEFVLRATGWKDRDKIEMRIMEVLDDVELSDKAHKMPHNLSGGEQQRTAIARALLNHPGIILADEPTGNLDSETADSIMRLLTKINRQEKTAVLMITHNTAICEKYPGKVFECCNETCKELRLDTQDEVKERI